MVVPVLTPQSFTQDPVSTLILVAAGFASTKNPVFNMTISAKKNVFIVSLPINSKSS